MAAIAVVVRLALAPDAVAQTGDKIGSPAGTTTSSPKQLPPPSPKFGGTIKDDALSSTPWWR